MTEQKIDLAANPTALLAFPTVKALTTLSRSEIYRRLAAGTFPQPIKIGPRSVRWQSRSIMGWLESVK